MTAYYCDVDTGNDGDDGLSEANAKATLAAGIGLLSSPGDILNLKNTSPYVLTSGITFTASGWFLIRGYTTTPGDGGKATITTATNSVNLLTGGAQARYLFRDLIFTNTAGTPGIGFVAIAASTHISFDRCDFDGFTNAINGDWVSNYRIDPLVCTRCTFTNCTAPAIYNTTTQCYECVFDGNQYAFRHSNTGGDCVFSRCLILNSTSHGIYDANTDVKSYTFHGCIIAKNGGSGIHLEQTTGLNLALTGGNILALNGAYGVNLGAATVAGHSCYTAFHDNTSGHRNNFSAGADDLELTVDPFEDSTNDDFSLNDTADGGADLRATTFTMSGAADTAVYPFGSWWTASAGSASMSRPVAMSGGLV